jgi:phage shock protein A
MNAKMKNPDRKIARLQKKEQRLVNKGNKAVDEGREKKADRVLYRAAKTQDRLIKTVEKKNKKEGKITKASKGKSIKKCKYGCK